MLNIKACEILCFPLTYDLKGFTCRINRHLLTVCFFLKKLPVCFNLFVLLFLVTPCLVVAVQSVWSGSQLKKL